MPTYPRGVTPCDLGSLLPDDLSGALREGLTAFGRKLAAYRAPDAVLTGLETGCTAPSSSAPRPARKLPTVSAGAR